MKKIIHLIICVFLASLTYANSIVAVLEIVPADETNLNSIMECRHLTGELRAKARETLPEGYTVLTRDNIVSLLPEDGDEAECLADGCVVDIGRAIGAEYVTQGFVGDFADMKSLTVELYEAMSGNFIGSFVTEAKDMKHLLKIIREESPSLFKKIFSKPSQNSEADEAGPKPESQPEPKPESRFRRPGGISFAQQRLALSQKFDFLDCDCNPNPEHPDDPELLQCLCTEDIQAYALQAMPYVQAYAPPPPLPPPPPPVQEVEKPIEKRDLADFGFQVRANLIDFYSGSKDFDDYLDFGFGIGFGVSFNHQFNKEFAVSPEINLYYRSLYTVDDSGDVGLQKTTFAEISLSVPVMLRYMLSENSNFYVEAGPQFDIPVWSFVHDDDENFQTFDDRSGFDFGFAIGAGYYITKSMAVDFRAVFGVSSSLSGRSIDKSTYNQYVIGFRF